MPFAQDTSMDRVLPPRGQMRPAALTGRPSAARLMPALLFALCLLAVASAVAADLGSVEAILLLGGTVVSAALLFFSALAPARALAVLFLTAYGAAGLTRYVPGPTGLAVDVVLAILLLGTFLHHAGRIEWRFLRSGAFAGIAAWALLCTFELLNPESASRVAWFYAVRGLAFYWLLGFPLLMMILAPKKAEETDEQAHDIRVMNRVIGWMLGLSAFGALWGIKQGVVGLDSFEQAWLTNPQNQTTHLLAGRLRVFSFYSDTAQFAVNMASAALMAVVLACSPRRPAGRALLLGLAALLFAALMLSGTRSAYIAFAAGFLVFLIVRRSFRMLMTGGLLMTVLFGVLRFTSAGHSIYAVQRMRQATDPFSDPSFLIRLNNQKRLASWLMEHPFGGGIGSAGYWGQRFSPGTFLADLPLDSWYVRIAAETGFPGLAVYTAAILGIGIQGLIVTWRESNPGRRQYLEPLVSVYWGVVFASYSNQYLGQIPTGFVMLAAICAFQASAMRREATA